MISKIFLIYLLLIILINDASGYIVVSGKITTTNDTAVQYAKIQFVSQQDTSVTFTTITNSLGKYIITITDVSEPVTVTKGFQLHQNYPNPFSEKTTISYSIPEKSYVTVSIYDILGRKVKSFQQEYKESGRYYVEWDGKDENGRKLSSGIYFYSLNTGEKRQVKKMLLLDDMITAESKIRVRGENREYFFEKPSWDVTNLYTVYIQNTDSTEPMIEESKIENIFVNCDTVINFQVTDLKLPQ